MEDKNEKLHENDKPKNDSTDSSKNSEDTSGENIKNEVSRTLSVDENEYRLVMEKALSDINNEENDDIKTVSETHQNEKQNELDIEVNEILENTIENINSNLTEINDKTANDEKIDNIKNNIENEKIQDSVEDKDNIDSSILNVDVEKYKTEIDKAIQFIHSQMIEKHKSEKSDKDDNFISVDVDEYLKDIERAIYDINSTTEISKVNDNVDISVDTEKYMNELKNALKEIHGQSIEETNIDDVLSVYVEQFKENIAKAIEDIHKNETSPIQNNEYTNDHSITSNERSPDQKETLVNDCLNEQNKSYKQTIVVEDNHNDERVEDVRCLLPNTDNSKISIQDEESIALIPQKSTTSIDCKSSEIVPAESIRKRSLYEEAKNSKSVVRQVSIR